MKIKPDGKELPIITATWQWLRRPEAGTLQWERFNRYFIYQDGKQRDF